jgi:hypothetical protein
MKSVGLEARRGGAVSFQRYNALVFLKVLDQPACIRRTRPERATRAKRSRLRAL